MMSFELHLVDARLRFSCWWRWCSFSTSYDDNMPTSDSCWADDDVNVRMEDSASYSRISRSAERGSIRFYKDRSGGRIWNVLLELAKKSCLHGKTYVYHVIIYHLICTNDNDVPICLPPIESIEQQLMHRQVSWCVYSVILLCLTRRYVCPCTIVLEILSRILWGQEWVMKFCRGGILPDVTTAW